MSRGQLTAAQLKELAADLEDLEASLNELLENTESGTQPVKLKDNAGRVSRMEELHNQGILMANRNVIKNRLKTVKRAQQHMEEGTYGVCAECDEMIAFPRLKAYPDSTLCIDCQREQESGS